MTKKKNVSLYFNEEQMILCNKMYGYYCQKTGKRLRIAEAFGLMLKDWKENNQGKKDYRKLITIQTLPKNDKKQNKQRP